MDNNKNMDNLENIKKHDVHILMVGLDDAGKTALLYKLKLGVDTENIPTIGYNVETLEFKKVNFTIWDIGGRKVIRHIWNDYTENKSAVIFVVDVAYRERFEEAKQYLHEIMAKDDLKETFLLIVANKQDKPEFKSNILDLEKSLDLKSLKQNWSICHSCTFGDWSLEIILQNLIENIDFSKQVLNKETINNQDQNMDTSENMVKKDEHHILMIGLDESGKTSLLYKLKCCKDIVTIPTIGFNVETIDFQNNSFVFWDVGGTPRIRSLWNFYTTYKSAVIFIVDSSNQERFEEAKQSLHTIMDNEDLQNTVLLIVANKQDKPEYNSNILNLEECLDLKTLKQYWRVCSSCAIGNYSLDSILQNLYEMIKNSVTT